MGEPRKGFEASGTFPSGGDRRAMRGDYGFAVHDYGHPALLGIMAEDGRSPGYPLKLAARFPFVKRR